jgi:hypothetical protein
LITQAELHAEILALAGGLANPWMRSRLLMGLAGQLSGEGLGRALEMAQAFTDPLARCRSLTYLAPRLDEPDRLAALQSAIAAAAALPERAQQAPLYNALAAQFARFDPPGALELSRRALQAASELTDEFALAWELRALPASLLEPGLAAARRIQAGYCRGLALAGLAANATGDLRLALLQEVRQLAARLAPDAGRGVLLSELLPALSEAELPASAAAALAALQGAPAEQVLQGLYNLSAALDEGLLPAALALAQSLPAGTLRVEAVSMLAPRLPDGQRRLLAEDCLALAAQIQDDWQKADAIIELAAWLEADQRPAAEAAAAAVGDGWPRAAALSALAAADPARAAALMEQALLAARSAESGWSRARALTSVARRLPG